jgi:NAD(P)-dependent dehydrogenase (short-subunit alcohol dehydrogenase family)
MALTEAVKPTAIVTGGASGFGAGAARRLARDSVNVAIFDLVSAMSRSGRELMYLILE